MALFAAVACGGDDSEDSEAAPQEQTGGELWSSASVESEYPGDPLVLRDEKDPTVPKKDIRLVQAPYNDHTYGSIGIRKGWFEEAGITIVPKPNGVVMLDVTQVAPAQLAGRIDVGTMASVIWLTAMDQDTSNKMFTYADIFFGHAFLGNPKGNYKTFRELIKDGMPFEQAVKTALAQIKGKSYAYPAETSQRPFQNYVLEQAGMSFKDVKSVVLDDPKIVELATAGRVDVASPTAGPLVTALLRIGWKPIISVKDLAESGDPKAIQSSLLSSGWSASDKWLADNHDTALRMASVMYRIIDYKQKDLIGAAKIQIPFLNSIAGTNFSPADAKYLDTEIDPFFSFEQQEAFFAEPNSPYNWEAIADAAINDAVKGGKQKAGHDADEVILADDTWEELRSLKILSEKLMSEVETDLEGDGADSDGAETAQKYAAQAKAFHAARNYLDAARFANAAKLHLEG
jgi:ABC-type nitrate/sulfonate/bicarbonate transport system substrate-binding protein